MPGLYSYFSSFQTVDSIYKISQRLDSNCRRLNLEATDLPTARQPSGHVSIFQRAPSQTLRKLFRYLCFNPTSSIQGLWSGPVFLNRVNFSKWSLEISKVPTYGQEIDLVYTTEVGRQVLASDREGTTKINLEHNFRRKIVIHKSACHKTPKMKTNNISFIWMHLPTYNQMDIAIKLAWSSMSPLLSNEPGPWGLYTMIHFFRLTDGSVGSIDTAKSFYLTCVN